MIQALRYTPLHEQPVYGSQVLRLDEGEFRHVYHLARCVKPTVQALTERIQQYARVAQTTSHKPSTHIVEALRRFFDAEDLARLGNDRAFVRELIQDFGPDLKRERPTPQYLKINMGMVTIPDCHNALDYRQWADHLNDDDQTRAPVRLTIRFTDWMLPAQGDLEALVTHGTIHSRTLHATDEYDPVHARAVIRSVYRRFSRPEQLRYIPNVSEELVGEISDQVFAGFVRASRAQIPGVMLLQIDPRSLLQEELSDPEIPDTVFISRNPSEKSGKPN